MSHYGPTSDGILRAALIAATKPVLQLAAHEITYHVDEAPHVEAWLASGAADRDFIEADPECPVPLWYGDDPHYQWTEAADSLHQRCQQARSSAQARQARAREQARRQAMAATTLPQQVIAEREHYRALEQQKILEQLADLFAYASTGPMGAA